MEQITFVELQLAVEHVYPQEVLSLLFGGEVIRGRLQRLPRGARVGARVPLGHRLLLLGQPSLHQELRVPAQLLDFL